jgi:hypothetical protein
VAIQLTRATTMQKAMTAISCHANFFCVFLAITN